MSLSERPCELGLHPGDWLAVFGDLANTDADASIDALLALLVDALGDDGHLLVPTFTGGAEFDVRTTPSITGRVAERFRRRRGVVRSLHPMFSVAVWGPRARDIVADHDLYLPFRPETPLGQLVEHDGKVLVLGTDQRPNALLHIGRLSVERERPVLWVNVDLLLEFGGRRRKRHIEPPCDRAYSTLGPEMESRGISRTLETAWGTMCRMAARDVFRFAASIERNDPQRLLCSDSQCRWCNGMRYFLNKEAKGP